MRPIVDPREGDVEDDASSTKQRTLVSLAGSLLAEISIPKLLAAWTILIVLPALLLGVAPLLISIWISMVSSKALAIFSGVLPALLLVVLIGLAWFGGRPLWRMMEANFWTLNALAVQPAYALSREALRQLAERFLPADADQRSRDTTRALSAAVSGLLICGLSILIVALAWPGTRWTGTLADLSSVSTLAHAALHNSIVIVAGYLAVAGLTWGLADTLMPQPRDLPLIGPAPVSGKIWRVAHLSDIHVVGERFGFRIEGGRSGPRGNEHFKAALAKLDAIHASEPLDLILISGDITDAGRSSEWAEFLDALSPYPHLTELMIMIPGNHDLNVVDRANPARLDLPTSPNRRLREIRALSTMAALQGDRVHVVDDATGEPRSTLNAFLEPYAERIARFADRGTMRGAWELANVWPQAFPMVMLPKTEDGLGIILLDSNAQTHFSFTNALGLVTREQTKAIETLARRYSKAKWIIALHHHVVEYPRAAKALSERIGTALVNGTWFVRRMQRLGGRAMLMHGHRHIDWIGSCGEVVIVSAPSPVMDVTDDRDTHFYIHSVGTGAEGAFTLFEPQRVVLRGGIDSAREDGPMAACDQAQAHRTGRRSSASMDSPHKM
ncbi:metallophosphoesterase [Hyphomicrobium sp.]|uniref:metallophosphoesterase family protein n=1 Tax=Hyphomicrobium sp. TaxID=82 RepID=UPI000FB1E839|nr:metallophosphoesterase [Hyphomicrobium sp.]RUP07711.1 MAG: metallophosphoesterase [Hyphomicrobium sp.]